MLASTTPRADILEVISNLSSDEVFTPPPVANAVLDLLPEDVWSDPSLRWLDPGAKTGVFLREAARRLMEGLEDEIPDEDKRREHILNNMLFGAAITELTALMARRSLYCSKEANGETSMAQMANPEGNIFFERVEHSFDKSSRCTECGGSKEQLERGDERENYAYAFIHEDGRNKMSEVMEMRFDVIVGNPPYQMDGGGGGTNATPLYNLFVDQAVDLNPAYISMVTPSRWLAGGRGLDDFRSRMLSDKRIRSLVDYLKMDAVFPGVDFEGGVSYFLWDRDHPGECHVTHVRDAETVGPDARELDEFDVFVRDEKAATILRKVIKRDEESVISLLSGDTPFGLSTNFAAYRPRKAGSGDIRLHLVKGGKREVGWIDQSVVRKSVELVDAWKVLVPQSYGERGAIPAQVLGPMKVAAPGSACTQTYLAVGPFDTNEQAHNFATYARTRFFRFLVSLRKISQHAFRSTYTWVPQQDWDLEWTDDALYEHYGINKNEQAYIEEMIKEMSE